METSVPDLPPAKSVWFWFVEPHYPTVREIQNAVCREFHVKRADMLAMRRTPDMAFPRLIAMYLAKELTLQGYPQIARRFNRGCHTTVLSAYRKIGRLIQSDPSLAATVRKLKGQFNDCADSPRLQTYGAARAASPNRASTSSRLNGEAAQHQAAGAGERT